MGGEGKGVVGGGGGRAWCGGRGGRFGGSHAGYRQGAPLKEPPPHLKTIVPTASVGPGLDFPKYNNVFGPYAIQWLTYLSCSTLRPAAVNGFPLCQAWVLKLRQGRVPLGDLPALPDPPPPLRRISLQRPFH